MSNQKRGDIKSLTIFSSKDPGRDVDLRAGVVEMNYYENILSPAITADIAISETNQSIDDDGPTNIIEGLPIRGGEQITGIVMDKYQRELKFVADSSLYVNKVSSQVEDTQKTIFGLHLCAKEFLANEQTRVVKRYEGKINDSVTSILSERLKTSFYQEKNIESTVNEYNFIGNDRKPFWTCSWLANKSIPESSAEYGAGAGFLFFMNQEGFNFKAIDSMFDQEPIQKYFFSESPYPDGEGEKRKIYDYSVVNALDLQQNLALGVYANRSLFFDFYKFEAFVREFSLMDDQKDKVTTAASKPDFVAEEFQTITRLMTAILDNGTMPSGKNAVEQLSNWNAARQAQNTKAGAAMVQSLMRYNQAYQVKHYVQMDLDLSLKAGDIIEISFPKAEGGKAGKYDKKKSGKYLIASLCHSITKSDPLTSLMLIRDSYNDPE